MDGETFLRRYFDQHMSDVAAETEERLLLLQGAQAAAEALVSVGALDEHVAETVLAEFRERLDPDEEEGIFVGPRGPLGTTEELGPFEWGDLSRFPPAPTLLRVIPVVQQGTIDDMRVTVISVDIWSDHMTLRSVATGDTDEMRSILWTWRVRDDQGGVYSRGGGQSGGSGRSYVIDCDFHPAPGPEVRSLVLSARRIRPIEDVRPDRMVPVTGIAAETLLSFEVPLL
jgi:hypothetical protein